MYNWFRSFTTMPALTPHGFCLSWQPGLLWTEAAADAATMLAYFCIPLALFWFVRKRSDLPHRWMAWLFVGFIVACGLTHGMDLLTLWVPAYQWQAVAKVLTALLSIATASLLWPLVPRLVALPSPAQLAQTASELRQTIARQQHTETRLRDSERRLLIAQETLLHSQETLLHSQETLLHSNERLEQRVAERTAELTGLNDALGKSEARFRNVVEAAPSAMLMVNRDGRIEMANTQAERMFGYSRDELLGSPVDMLVPPAVRDRHPGLRAGFLADPRSRPMGAGSILFGNRHDGSQFEVEIGLNPIETAEGMMVLSVILDISERVALEAQLRQSQKMQAVGRITAGVAHDFNNLLQALSGSLELLHDVVADRPDATEWVQMATRAARHGREVTGRLLAFSRQQVLTARAVLVAPLFRDVAELIGHLFQSRSHEEANELIIDPGPEHLAVFADAAQLEAALLNLAVNARDAMTAGGRLRIAARRAEAEPAFVEPGRYIVLTVADTGSGMDAATLALACDPFFSTKGKQGTGLGLSMVQGFARQSGGEVRIASVLGEGTIVEMWLPAAGSPDPPPVAATLPAVTPQRILLVDDSADVLVSTGAFLRKAGLQVIAVESAELALAELAEHGHFDLLITDIGMPGINGLDLLAHARRLDPTLPAIVITGFFDFAGQSELLDAAFLPKPFTRSELLAKISQATAGRLQSQTGDARPGPSGGAG